jgi:hypothetical protein
MRWWRVAAAKSVSTVHADFGVTAGDLLFPWQGLSYSAQSVGLLPGASYLVPVFLAGIVFTEVSKREKRRHSGQISVVAWRAAWRKSFVHRGHESAAHSGR